MKRSLTIDYGDDVLLALGMSPEQFCEEAKILIAARLIHGWSADAERSVSSSLIF